MHGLIVKSVDQLCLSTSGHGIIQHAKKKMNKIDPNHLVHIKDA